MGKEKEWLKVRVLPETYDEEVVIGGDFFDFSGFTGFTDAEKYRAAGDQDLIRVLFDYDTRERIPDDYKFYVDFFFHQPYDVFNFLKEKLEVIDG